MPIYEFECLACGQRFSQFSRRMMGSDDAPAEPCPACQGSDTRRVVSAFAARIAGAAANVGGGGAAESSAGATTQSSVTPRESIDRWRKGR